MLPRTDDDETSAPECRDNATTGRRSCVKPCEHLRPRKLQLLQPSRKIRDVNCSSGSYNFKERDRCNGDATNEVAAGNEKHAHKNRTDAISFLGERTILTGCVSRFSFFK